jgi:hypothetical protein
MPRPASFLRILRGLLRANPQNADALRRRVFPLRGTRPSQGVGMSSAGLLSHKGLYMRKITNIISTAAIAAILTCTQAWAQSSGSTSASHGPPGLPSTPPPGPPGLPSSTSPVQPGPPGLPSTTAPGQTSTPGQAGTSGQTNAPGSPGEAPPGQPSPMQPGPAQTAPAPGQTPVAPAQQ